LEVQDNLKVVPAGKKEEIEDNLRIILAAKYKD
jgi:hypothetical protein